MRFDPPTHPTSIRDQGRAVSRAGSADEAGEDAEGIVGAGDGVDVGGASRSLGSDRLPARRLHFKVSKARGAIEPDGGDPMVAQSHSKPTPHRFSTLDGSLASETKRTLRILVAVAAPVGAFLFMIEAIFGKRTIQLLMMDANTVNGAEFFHGLISTAGTAIWLGSALLILLSVLLPRSRPEAPFLIMMLILTLVLSLDDLMQLHEIVFPTYLGVSEGVTYGFYLAFTVATLVVSRRTILNNEPLLLMASFAFFAASVAADAVFADMPLLWRLSGFGFEDGCKLIAIGLWTTYFLRFPLRKFQ